MARKLTTCTNPAQGSQLADYITNSLDDEAAFTVERHLAECGHCKQRYLTVLRVRESGRRKRLLLRT